MDPALRELARRGDPDDELAVLLRLRQAEVPPRAARIVTQFGDVATARVRRRHIAELWAEPEVASVKAPHRYAPDVEPWDPELEPPADPNDDGRSSGAPTGRHVVIGMVDWGLDITNQDFRRPDGTTRLLAMWDQRPWRSGESGMWRRAEPYGYGRIFDARQIDAALRTADAAAALDYQAADFDAGPGAHGTHTTSIAAGNGRGGGPPGVAREASLVFVNLGRQQDTGNVPLSDSSELLEAIHFILWTAGTQPCVINLSLGRHAGEHTGHSLVEKALDHLVSEAPGRAVVQSCGNYHQRRTHHSHRMRPGEVHDIHLTVDPLDRTANQVDLWYPGRDRLLVRVTGEPVDADVTVPLGESGAVVVDGREVARVYHRERDPNNGDNQISVYADLDSAVTGWRISLTGLDVVDGRVHAWIERDAGCRTCQARFVGDQADRRATLGTIATGYHTIAVGAYDAHRPERPLGPFSSSGPTRDGRRKPDLVAPGVMVLGARSRPRGSRSPGGYVRMSGTSMAAPAVTGTVALMFEAAGRLLSIGETRRALLASCDPAPAGTDPWRVGSGYLNPRRAVESVLPPLHVEEAMPEPFAEIVPEPAGWLPPVDLSLAESPAAEALGSGCLGRTRVAVVGGGFSGLMAAWSLETGGAMVTVFEASNRLGGRVRSDLSVGHGKVIEAGAELIGENHPTWIALARRFGLPLVRISGEEEYARRGLKVRTRLGGTDLTDIQRQELDRELARVRTRIANEAATVDPLRPWLSARAATLDAKSLAERLDEADLFGRTTSIARRYFELTAENDQCAPTARQSYLGYLAAVRAHMLPGDPLAYWTRIETHRCKGGNEQLATHLARTLRDIRLNTPVTAVEIGSRAVQVVTGSGSASYDYVILATAPTVWPRVHAGAPFRPADYTMSHGPAVKFLSIFAHPFWQDSGLAPSAWWDRLGSVWEGTDKQEGATGHCLSVYSGGGLVLDATGYGNRLEELYPGYRGARPATSFADWTAEPWVRTGYSIPSPGQVTTVARNLATPFQGRLVFAGEQASPGFYGYMEGALSSGVLAAYRIVAAVAACRSTAETESDVFGCGDLAGAGEIASACGPSTQPPVPSPAAAVAGPAETAADEIEIIDSEPAPSPDQSRDLVARLDDVLVRRSTGLDDPGSAQPQPWCSHVLAAAGLPDQPWPTEAALFDAYVGGSEPAKSSSALDVVALPGTDLPALRAGDLVLSRGRGSPFACLTVVAGTDLRHHGQLRPAGYTTDDRLPGLYVHVLHPAPRPWSQRYAQRVATPARIVPGHILILRPAQMETLAEGSAETVIGPCPDVPVPPAARPRALRRGTQHPAVRESSESSTPSMRSGSRPGYRDWRVPRCRRTAATAATRRQR